MFLNYNSPLLDDKTISEFTKCKICGKDISDKQVLDHLGLCSDCTCFAD